MESEILTPQHTIMDTKQLHLSTRGDAGQVLNGNLKSQIRFSIPDAIIRDESIEYIQFSIPYAIIPNSFYVINMTNCMLVVSLAPYTVETTYMFPMGNYTASTFITQFKALLPVEFNIILNNVTQAFTVTHTTTEFKFMDSSTIDSIMGFSGSITSAALTLVMPRVCNFLPLPRICIRCADLANSFISATNDSADVVLSVPNNARLNGQIIYNNQTGAKNLFKLDKLVDFVVSLTDDDGIPIDFNGVSSFFVFQFDIFRKSLKKPLPFNQLVNMINSATGR
jgi:hypothetical protein